MLEKRIRVDVAVVGGGIAGLSVALRLLREGKRVAVLDQAKIAQGETGRSTAHLTEFLDLSYRELIRSFGKEGAKRVSEANREALRFIERTAKELDRGFDAQSGFRSMPAYLYAEDETELEDLRLELAAIWDLGVAAYWTDEVPLLGPALGGIEMERQAVVDPIRYASGLAKLLENEGCLFFEETRVTAIEEGEPCKVVTEKGSVRADQVVVATHVPVANGLFMQTKIAAYRTYAIAVRLYERPKDALFFDRKDPYHYMRPLQDGSDIWIIGGEDHKTGTEEDPAARFDRLEKFAEKNFGVRGVEARWSGQILEPSDGLPYIGKSGSSGNIYVATGFSGTGMTYGTVAGMLIPDLILGRDNPWEEVFRATRMNPLAAFTSYVSENADFPKYYVKDRIQDGEVDSPDDIAPGEGKRVRSRGKVLAVYRDEESELHAVNAVCTHAGCYVHWNGAETTWDCPCHGSRFSVEGKVLNGPAVEDLPKETLANDDPEVLEPNDVDESGIPVFQPGRWVPPPPALL